MRIEAPPAAIVGTLWGLSEFLLNLVKRSKAGAVSKDRHSVGLIWVVNLAAVAVAIWAAYSVPFGRFSNGQIATQIGCGLFAVGLALRWYAIIHLGRFFTTNVAIAADHRVVDDGPYRFVRHPSYTGAMLAVLGVGLCFQNWVSLLLLFIPSCAATMWRIHVEEQALTSSLGPAYSTYAARTKRLIPLIY
jgi:protein-S-isoprenylcysteine O-methyltransferase